VSRSEAEIRQHMAIEPLDDLWARACMHISFRDDAPADFVANSNLIRAIACDLTGYVEFWARPMKPVPSDAAWVWGREDRAAYDQLCADYPAIAEYFAWSKAAPSTYFWRQVARFDMWRDLELMLTEATSLRSKVTDWTDVEDKLMDLAVQTHLENWRKRPSTE
jgi:hypothetical protein